MILDLIKRTVFKRGTLAGSKTKTLTGGHLYLVSATTLKLEWKNAQKNPKKNKTSELINQSIAIFKLDWTHSVWNLPKQASRLTSRHQNLVTKIKLITLATILTIEAECIKSHKLESKRNLDIAAKIGQGEASTKWYGVDRAKKNGIHTSIAKI